AGIMGVCSNVSSVFQVPTKARRSFISAAGLGIAGPDAAGAADFFFFASLFSCAPAEVQSSTAVNSVINVFMIHPSEQASRLPRPAPGPDVAPFPPLVPPVDPGAPAFSHGGRAR